MAVRLQANRPLFGSYSGREHVAVGVHEVFESSEETAYLLECRGLARRPDTPSQAAALAAMLVRMRAT
jgi:hypothetical protein